MDDELQTADHLAAAEVAPKRGLVPVPNEYGWLHDRSLGGVIGFLLSLLAIGHMVPPPGPVHIGLIFGAGTGVGAVLAKYVPPRFRELLQAVLFFVAVIVGGSFLTGCAVTYARPGGVSFGIYPGVAPAEDTIQTLDFTVVGVSIDATRESLDIGYKAGRVTSIPTSCKDVTVPSVLSAKSVSGSLTGGTTISDTLTVGHPSP
jgi:hypothetical protein